MSLRMYVSLRRHHYTDRMWLEEPHWLAHGRLEVERPDILPVLLEQRHEEIHGHLRIDEEFLLGHVHVAYGDSHAQHLFQLELHTRLHLLYLGGEVLVMRGERWELASLVEAWAEQSRDHLDDGIGCEEVVVLLREFLHQFLVLVQLLQRLDLHRVDAHATSLITVLCVTQHAHLELGSRNIRQLHCAVETLVLLRIIVFQLCSE